MKLLYECYPTNISTALLLPRSCLKFAHRPLHRRQLTDCVIIGRKKPFCFEYPLAFDLVMQ